jgi:hypothetical protein
MKVRVYVMAIRMYARPVIGGVHRGGAVSQGGREGNPRVRSVLMTI